MTFIYSRLSNNHQGSSYHLTSGNCFARTGSYNNCPTLLLCSGRNKGTFDGPSSLSLHNS